MSEETARKGRSVALSGAIGFILVALLVGMLIGGAISLVVIAPLMQGDNQGNNYQGTDNNQNDNNNSQGTDNNQNGNNNQGPSGSEGLSNNNPPITNPTSEYASTSSQFSVSIPDQNGGKTSGTISADVNCAVQQNGNNIQLDFTITPTSIPQSLSQTMSNSPVTFNFAGTTSGSQISAEATGTTGPDNAITFDFNLNGSFSSNTLTLTITSASNSQISVSTPHSITLQSS